MIYVNNKFPENQGGAVPCDPNAILT